MIGPVQVLEERSLERRLEARITRFFEEREESLGVTLSGERLLMNEFGAISGRPPGPARG